MGIFRCKMCGGSLEIRENQTTAVCEYCGTTQTLPRLEDERRANLYDRANHFRRNNEFDKAMGIYEKILNEDSTDAEAYWSLVLCRYGIEYVEDPATHKRVPTVNRAQFTSIFDDEDYKSALQYADNSQKAIYQAEAETINEIQKGILAISQKEEPFDVFICYKETDAQGRRTPDSVLANDLYHQLTQEGFKVFFSRITLEDKLGTAYEPYIFAALNSAKVMVVIGTKPEYFNAVWVKNEWSRYLALIKNGAKKVLIPAYRDMDPYDLPEEFSHLQAQDMSKLGFMQDLIRGIKKLTRAEVPRGTVIRETVFSGGNTKTAPLLERAFMFLEDGNWREADSYCEKVLDIEPRNPLAYLGKLMAERKVSRREELRNLDKPFEDSLNYQKAHRFGDSALQNELDGYITYIRERLELERQEAVYQRAKGLMGRIHTWKEYQGVQSLFESAGDYRDAVQLAKKCEALAAEAAAEEVYVQACRDQKIDIEASLTRAASAFRSISQWKDAAQRAQACEARIIQIQREVEARRIAERRNRRITKIVYITALVILVIAAVGLTFYFSLISPMLRYNQGIKYLEAGEYQQAISVFAELGNYKDAAARIPEVQYIQAESFLASGQYQEAVGAFRALGDYKDAATRLPKVQYIQAESFLIVGQYREAMETFKALGDYRDAADRAGEIAYSQAEACLRKGNLAEAAMYYGRAGAYLDAQKQSMKLWEQVAHRTTISAGWNHTLGLKSNGTVVTVGWNDSHQCEVFDWRDIIAVSAGGEHSVGLKSDGTVVAVGWNGDGQCDVSEWSGIVAVSAGYNHTVGLKSDGTVVAVGENDDGRCNVSEWSDIVAISAGSKHTIGLKSDGTVVAVGWNGYGQCDVSGWNEVIAVSAGGSHTVALKSNGEVLAVGNDSSGRCDVFDWNGNVAISAGGSHTVALKADRAIVVAGWNEYGQCNVSGWSGIEAISAGGSHTVGLKSDGTVVAVGSNTYGQCDVSGWTDIRIPRQTVGE